MNLPRKIKTAITVLANDGLGEVFGLLKDNFSALFSRFDYFLIHRFNRISTKIAVKAPHSNAKMRILYITSEFEALHSQTVRYRIHNFRKAIRGRAQSVFAILNDDLLESNLINWADIVVLMRTTWFPQVKKIIKKANDLKKPVVFDVDDLIFLPSFAADYCKVLENTCKRNVRRRREEFGGFEKTFRHSDYATASTHFIAEQMKKEGKKAFVIHNALNKKQIKIANSVKKPKRAKKAIGYLSGTKTHDRDFKVALPAIVKIMEEHPDVILNIAGYLDFDNLPQIVQKRAHITPYMSWPRLMRFGAKNYINIAPLDVENPFCHAKSELKYFEAAVAAVPSVVSATDTYKRCIENGVNGMLAITEDDWYNALKKLLEDKEFYSKISSNARKSALEHYSPEANANEIITAYSAIIKDYQERNAV